MKRSALTALLFSCLLAGTAFAQATLVTPEKLTRFHLFYSYPGCTILTTSKNFLIVENGCSKEVTITDVTAGSEPLGPDGEPVAPGTTVKFPDQTSLLPLGMSLWSNEGISPEVFRTFTLAKDGADCKAALPKNDGACSAVSVPPRHVVKFLLPPKSYFDILGTSSEPHDVEKMNGLLQIRGVFFGFIYERTGGK